MIVKKIDPIINKTAKDLNISEEQTALIVNHLFQLIRDWTNNPTSPALLIKEVGTLYMLDRSINSKLIDLVRLIRRDREEGNTQKETLHITQFRHFWPLRHLARDYKKSLKRPNCARIPRYLRKS